MSILKEELLRQREKLESYLETVSATGIALINPSLSILDCNQGFTKMFNLQQKPIGESVTNFLILCKEDLKNAKEFKLSCRHQAGVISTIHCRAVETKKGYLLFCERLIMTESHAIEQIAIINNELINLQRESVKKNLLLEKLRRELDERILELEATIVARKQAEAEKEKLEAQNRQLQKAESLGRMAGAIAHHFNNQLGVVLGNLELAMMELPDGTEPDDNLTAAMAASNKAAEMSRMMLTYLGQSSNKREPLDLSYSCCKIMPILKATMPGNVTLETDFSSPHPVINTNADYLQQILANLIINAWEAVGGNRGTISVNVKTVSPAIIPTAQRFPVDWKLPDDPCACLEVTDTGCGIAAKDIEQIFDPFFSTKFTGRGMGLAVVLGIVKAHNGVITVSSKPGIGSTFRVFFPITEEALKKPQKAKSKDDSVISAVSPGKFEEGGTVLVVEDEKPLRNMVATMLKRFGFTVLAAKDGVEAMEVFRQHQSEIKLVISDLTMPRMNGWEMLTALRKQKPGIRVILASGYDKAHVMSGDHPELPEAFLGKPYNREALGDTIRQVLGKAD